MTLLATLARFLGLWLICHETADIAAMRRHALIGGLAAGHDDTDDNLCTRCDVEVVQRDENFRDATADERRQYPAVRAYNARVARAHCPRCGHVGLAIEWSKVNREDTEA